MTVKPVDADDVITSTTVLPIVFQKSVVGNRHLPFKVVCHQVYDTLVLRILVIRLQAPKHNHLCPKFAFPIAFVDRAENNRPAGDWQIRLQSSIWFLLSSSDHSEYMPNCYTLSQ